MSKMDDGYRNKVNQDDYRYQDGSYDGYAPNDGYYQGGEEPGQEEDAQSDATEGHDEDDEVYEGEYQGIPHPDDVAPKKKRKSQGLSDEFKDQADLMAEKMEDEEQLAHQYETIIEECSHGRFQWILFIVLGLALMAEEVFVVGFVLPGAEKDMCLSRTNKGMLGEPSNS